VIEQRLDDGFSFFTVELKFGEFKNYEIPVRNGYVKRRYCFFLKKISLGQSLTR
jgi:hypothetical protein